MKVCDLTQFYSPVSGGVKRYLHEKIAYIQSATPHQHVLVVPGARTECIETERSRIYTIHSPLISRTSRYRALVNLRAVDEILDRERPDLIESADPYQLGWKAIASGAVLDVAVIAFYHSHFPEAYIRRVAHFLGATAGERMMGWARRYVCRLYNSFQLTLVPSESLALVLEKWGVKNVRPVSLGVNTETFTPAPEDARATRAQLDIPSTRRLLLYVGRLSKEKNTQGLFRAFEILNARAPGLFHLLIIGDGSEREELFKLQANHANVTWIRYCAEPADLARYYRAADLLVHAGTQETFGLVALESQACGTPVAGIRGSYMDEVILHDQAWWAEENTPESLASAIHAACKCEINPLGRRAAHAAAAQFSWPRVFERLFYIYEEVCSNYGKQHGSTRNASLCNSPLSSI